MASFDEDAFARANQINRQPRYNQGNFQGNYQSNNSMHNKGFSQAESNSKQGKGFSQADNFSQQHRERTGNTGNEKSDPPIERNQPKEQNNHSENSAQQTKNDGLLDVLFKDKEQSLILLLIILLMEENSEPTLLLALVYLLI